MNVEPFRRGRILVSVGAACAALIVTSCSSDDKPSNSPDKSDSSSAVSNPTVPGGSNGGISDATGARADLIGFECAKSKTGWTAKGTLQNPDSGETTYLVTVSVFSKKEGTVFGQKEEKITLKGKKKSELLYENFYKGKDKGADCTARVVKGN